MESTLKPKAISPMESRVYLRQAMTISQLSTRPRQSLLLKFLDTHAPEEEIGHINGLARVGRLVEDLQQLAAVALEDVAHVLQLLHLEHVTRDLPASPS